MLINILVFMCTLILCGYLFVRKKYSYWAERGVKFNKPEFPYGFLKGVGKKYHSSQKIKQIYDELKNHRPFIGMYTLLRPVILVTDVEFVKTICVRDFQYFVNRGLYFNEKDDPLSAHLLNIEDQRWKNLRSKLTPTFTSGKMKFMFPTIINVAEEFKKCIVNELETNSEIELKDIVARFTTDVIGNCAFGLECNSLKNPDAEFREMGKLVFEKPRNSAVKLFFMSQFRELAKALHFVSNRDDVSKFFLNAVKQTIDYRTKNNIQKNDFMNLLIQLYKENNCQDSSDDRYTLTFEEIAAQAYVFFLAGFETSSTAMSYALYELAQHQDIQNKARKEIIEILEKYDGNLTYEAISEMKYIDQIINESLRKYPPGSNLLRVTNADYKVPNTNYTLEKGTTVFIPVYSIHHDSNHYPNPEEFNPERFSEEEIKKRHPYTFLSFGEGPRNCIGLRFGMMQVRIGLVTLLLNFKFTNCKKTIIPLTFKPSALILTANGGLWLNVQKV